MDLVNRLCTRVGLREDESLDMITVAVTDIVSALSEDETLRIGTDLLRKFIQLNWTGPHKENFTLNGTKDTLERLNQCCLKEVLCDGEAWYAQTRYPFFLLVAHVLLVEIRHQSWRAAKWAVRCLFVQQRLLDFRSQSLWNQIQHIIENELVPLLPSASAADSVSLTRDEQCSLRLELASCLLYHSQYESAQHHLDEARHLANLTLNLTGALGKRTKFQQDSTAQLVLTVAATVSEDDQDRKKIDRKPTHLPNDVQLDDDTLLGGVQLSDTSDLHLPPLSSLQQAVILDQCVHVYRSTARHRLTNEELEAYIMHLLSQPQCWVVQTTALWLRSHLQRSHYRTTQRSIMQLQELVASFSRSLPKVCDRQELFFCVLLPPCWEIEKELADTLAVAGAVQSALTLYQRLGMWNRVIECYQSAGRHSHAEQVVKERMKLEGETPLLLCLLGDATQDAGCYQKAWELSEKKSARAQRSLGLYYLRREEYGECVKSLQLSLAINSLQESLWFSLGHAASKLENHLLASQAFRQYVSLEPDNGEAWNNLASAYLKRKEKVRAFNAFQEALKCSYDNWKIWENYLLVALDIGELEEVIRTYHRLLDIKGKHLDAEVLQYLCNAVTKDVPTRNERPASYLREKLDKLLERVTTQTTSSAELWKICADLHLSSGDAVDRDQGLLELQKAQRTARQQSGWEKENVQQVVTLTIRYSQTCRECIRGQSQQKAVQTMSSAKLALQGVISKLKNSQIETGGMLLDQLTEEQELVLTDLTTLK